MYIIPPLPPSLLTDGKTPIQSPPLSPRPRSRPGGGPGSGRGWRGRTCGRIRGGGEEGADKELRVQRMDRGSGDSIPGGGLDWRARGAVAGNDDETTAKSARRKSSYGVGSKSIKNIGEIHRNQKIPRNTLPLWFCFGFVPIFFSSASFISSVSALWYNTTVFCTIASQKLIILAMYSCAAKTHKAERTPKDTCPQE